MRIPLSLYTDLRKIEQVEFSTLRTKTHRNPQTSKNQAIDIGPGDDKMICSIPPRKHKLLPPEWTPDCPCIGKLLPALISNIVQANVSEYQTSCDASRCITHYRLCFPTPLKQFLHGLETWPLRLLEMAQKRITAPEHQRKRPHGVLHITSPKIIQRGFDRIRKTCIIVPWRLDVHSMGKPQTDDLKDSPEAAHVWNGQILCAKECRISKLL